MSIYTRWHGKDRYFGLHYDLHGAKDDTVLGTKAQPELLVPMLKIMAPDFVQTDCKGHPGARSSPPLPLLRVVGLGGRRETSRVGGKRSRRGTGGCTVWLQSR